MDPMVFIYAAVGGIVPALVWVYFWTREDTHHPEPLQLIVAAFLAGMVATIITIPFQKIALSLLTGSAVVIAWAAIEEVVKFLCAYVTVLRNPADNEPVDPLIYMITVALGFAALENTLFLISPLMTSGAIESILSGNFRFLGATLLHVLASSMIGVALGVTFYKRRSIKVLAGAVGLILAILLHSIFNFLILNSPSGELLRVFALVWIGLIILLVIFEHVKRITKHT